MLAELQNLEDRGTLPARTRGNLIIFDYFSATTQAGFRQLLSQGGLDGQGNFFTADMSHALLSGNSSGSKAYRTYKAFMPYQPGAVLTPTLSDSQGTVVIDWASTDPVAAYRAARTANPLVSRSQHSTDYAKPRVIFNFSSNNALTYYQHFATRLLGTDLDTNQDGQQDFQAQAGTSFLGEGIVGVGALKGASESAQTNNAGAGNSGQCAVHVGNLPDPDNENCTLTSPAPFRISTTPISLPANERLVEFSAGVADLLDDTPTDALIELIDHTGWQTPNQRIAATFPSAAEGSAIFTAGSELLHIAGFDIELSHLKYLALATIYSRTGSFYTAASLNADSTALQTSEQCGLVRDGCFVLPYYRPPDGQNSTDLAAPRLAAMLDTVWMIWPHLTNRQMHKLLAGCAKDLGDQGVDAVYGQGLLDFACIAQPSGGLNLPVGLPKPVAGVRGALYGASTASTALTTYDAFGRDFEHQVLHKNLQARPAFDPMHNALVHKAFGFLELTANERTASAWLTKQAKGNLYLGIGAAYEGDSLFGMSGSGHFAIHDGRSLGLRLELDQPLSNFWNMRLSLAHYKGTASAAYPGAVSDLALEQSNSSITFERRFSGKASAAFKAACSSGNSGTFHSFGTRITLFGASNCSHSIGAQIRF